MGSPAGTKERTSLAKPLSSLRDLLPLQTSFPSHQWLGYFQQTEPFPETAGILDANCNK